MIIKNIELKNIRSHKNTSITIPRGVVLIKGEVGSGKTSILDGLKFALFGSFQNAETLLRVGENQGEVSVTLDRDGSDIIFKRVLKRTKTGFSSNEIVVVENGIERRISDGEMRNYISKLFRVKFERAKDPKFFDLLFYAGQDEMRNILEMKSEEKLKIIYDLFGITDFKNISENIELLKGIVKNEIEMRKFRIGENRELINESEKRLEEIKNEITIYSENLKKLNEEIEKMEREFSSIKNSYDEMERKRKEFENLKSELNENKIKIDEKKNNRMKIGEKIKNYENELKRKEDLEKKEKELEIKKELLEKLNRDHEVYVLLKKQLNENEKVLDELNEKRIKMQNLGNDLIKIEEKIKEMEDKVKIKSEVENEIEEIRKELESMRSDLKATEREKKTQEEQLKKYINLRYEKKCPVCGRPITEDLVENLVNEENKKLNSSMEKLNELSSKIDKLEKIKSEKSGILESLKNDEKELNNLKIEKVRYEKEIENIRKDVEKIPEIMNEIENERNEIKKYENIDSEIKKLKDEIKSLEKYHDEYQRLLEMESEINKIKEEYSEIENEIVEINEKILNIENEIKKVGYDENMHKEIEEKYHEIDKKLMQKKTLFDEQNRKISELKENLSRESRNYQELLKFEKEKENLENFLIWMDKIFKPLVENLRELRIQKIRIELTKKLREWIDVLLPERSWDVDLLDDFSPVVYIDGYRVSYESLSGGESTALAFSYRLALNSMLKEFHNLETNFLLLDEPTDGFSEAEISNMNGVFEKINTDQIIIVSHEKELENFADHTISIKKENNESMTIF